MSDELLERRIKILEDKVTNLERSVGTVTEGIDEILTVLRGDTDTPGLIAKIHVIWGSYVWVFCTLAALAGSFLTWVVTRLSVNLPN